jgi:hypothetical protein
MLEILIASLIVTVLLIVAIVFLILRWPKKDDRDCSEPMWNVMISTQNIARNAVSSSLYPEGAVRIIQVDKKHLYLRSRLLPVRNTYALYLQTNGSYPNPDQDYQSALLSMVEGLHDIIGLSDKRTVSCGAYLHIDRSSASGDGNYETSTVPVGFDIAEGGVRLTVAKLQEFENYAEGIDSEYLDSETGWDHTHMVRSQLSADITHLKSQYTTEAYNAVTEEMFFFFTIRGSTESYVVTNTDEIDSPLDAEKNATGDGSDGDLIPIGACAAGHCDSDHRLVYGDVTIWFDGFWKSVTHSVNKAANDTANAVAHISETVYNGVSDAANATANAISHAACGSCLAINETALRATQLIATGATGAAFCAAYGASIQTAVIPFLPECPQCESLPITTTLVCTSVFGAIVSTGVNLAAPDGQAKAAKMFCEAEKMC